MLFADNPRYRNIVDLLTERDGRCLWQVPGRRAERHFDLEAWRIRDNLLIVQVFQTGVEIYANGAPSKWADIAAWLDRLAGRNEAAEAERVERTRALAVELLEEPARERD